MKIQIDNNRKNYGKWLLTGSQQFDIMENISESLAGRISIIHLETLSVAELRNSNVKKPADYLWKGGYPELWSNENIDLTDFFESYMRTYIERDLRKIIEVKNLNDFRRFFRILSARIGQLLNYNDIARDVGVSDITIKKWVHALEISGLVYLLPPFFTNVGKRLTKSSKLYFADHGLACYLHGIESLDDWQEHPHKGNLWENLVMMEMVKENMLIPGVNMFFYRDKNGIEIDFIIEKKGKLFFIEAKAGERVDAKGLNFKKVVPLFEKGYKIQSILANTNTENRIIKTGHYDCYNPLLVGYELN